MIRIARRFLVAAWAGSMFLASSVFAEVVNIRGNAKATVVQFSGVFPVQTDFNQEIVPVTKNAPPATARARIDRLSSEGETTAAGQALAQLDDPNLITDGSSNDVGMDLGAFSEDAETGWFVEGTVQETRTLRLVATEVTPDSLNGSSVKVRSRVLLSGAMLLTAAQTGKDLSGARVTLTFSVTLRQPPREDETVLSGAVTLLGVADGDAVVDSPTGALAGIFLPIIDFTDQLEELPLARAILFSGVNLPYEYSVTLNQDYELELNVRSQIFTTPDGVGASAVFGLPQDGIGSVLTRVKGDDRGVRLANRIAQQVDTTGAAYADTPLNAVSLTSYFPLCGVAGMESAGLFAVIGLIGFSRLGLPVRRRFRARSPGRGRAGG